MRAPVIIELNPVGDDPHRMLLGLEAVTIQSLFLQGPDNAFDHAILAGTMGRDELLFQPLAPIGLGHMVCSGS